MIIAVMTTPCRADRQRSTAAVRPRSVLVTGASGGIGQAVSRAFGNAGCCVGVHYHKDKASAESILRQIERTGGTGALYQADMRDGHSVRQMIDAFRQDASRPIGFVCAAGVGGGQLVLKLGEEEWAEIVTTNLTGLFHCFRAMAPALQVQGGGSIVVIGSYAGYQGSTGQAAYAASKAGIVALVKTAALEWGADNICVNVLWPGWQRTELTEAAFPGNEGWRDHVLGRPPALQEVVSTVMHVAGLQDVSGQVWNCDSRLCVL
jgi:3-oxoacyl-[acyl-carrier protein] reductase